MKTIKKVIGMLAFSLFVTPCSVMAQNNTERVDSTSCEPEEDWIIEVTEDENGNEVVSDTIWLGKSDVAPLVTQYELKDCDHVNICAENPKYAIVVKNGKYGIYDMILHKNITEIQFDELGDLRQTTNNGLKTSSFFVREGRKRGILCVNEANNLTMYVWSEDGN